METMIRLSDITKIYENTTIISVEKLIFEQGKIYGILGKNGVGKTTLFKIITGLKTATTGQIEILGKIQNEKQKTYLKQLGINIDTPRFYEHLTAYDNLVLHLQLMNAENYIDDIKSTLEQVDLDVENKLPIAKYSLGMKQRLTIARSIIHKPKILILDEPMNGLDPTSAKQVRTLFTKLAKEEKMTILISSHIISDIVQFVDEVIILSSGVVALNATIEALEKTYNENVEYAIIRKMEGN